MATSTFIKLLVPMARSRIRRSGFSSYVVYSENL
jgi:hypothetical protein